MPLREANSVEGASLASIRDFAEPARQRVGYELYRVQCGIAPSDWKPLSSIGPNVREIRIRTTDEFRVIYVASFAEAIYVLHAFQKKTRRRQSMIWRLRRCDFENY